MGLETQTFEILDHPSQDMLTPGGFCTALSQVMQTKAGGLQLYGIRLGRAQGLLKRFARVPVWCCVFAYDVLISECGNASASAFA
eukprot:5397931-Alexandrium_andersonii.AAC.1